MWHYSEIFDQQNQSSLSQCFQEIYAFFPSISVTSLDRWGLWVVITHQFTGRVMIMSLPLKKHGRETKSLSWVSRVGIFHLWNFKFLSNSYPNGDVQHYIPTVCELHSMTSPVLILQHVKNQLTNNLLLIASTLYHLARYISNDLEKISGCHGVWGLIFKPSEHEL